MLVAERFKIRGKGWGKKLASALCALSIAAVTMAGVPSTSEAAVSVTGEDIVRTAVSYLGTPYVSGGASRSGVDCSGFVYAVLTEVGFSNVPRSTAAWAASASSISYKGQAVQVRTLDASNPNYDAKPGDVLVYNGHVTICMGRAGNWGSCSDIRSYTNAMGGNSGLVFEDGSPWPVKSPWYRIHARSAPANAEGRITGVEIDDTNTGATSTSYALKAYRFAATGNSENSGDSGSLGAPAITNFKISDVTSAGYQVTMNIINSSNVVSITLPTWTSANGQDEITWDSVPVNDTVSYYVKTSRHKNESGIYNTQVYLQDRNGKNIIGGGDVFVPASDQNSGNDTNVGDGKASIADVNISEVSASGYTVTVKLVNPSNITSLTLPTWSSANGQDEITWDSPVINGDTVTYRVNTSSHKNEAGEYNTHIHLYDRSGNFVIEGKQVRVPAQGSSNNNERAKVTDIQVSDRNSSGYTVTATVSNPERIQNIVFPTWTIANGQDDIIWGQPIRSGNTFTYQVKTNAHGFEKGIYATHIHLYDISGEFTIEAKEVAMP